MDHSQVDVWKKPIGERAQRKARDRAGGIDDDGSRRPIEIGRGWPELPHREHIEHDVQQAGVKPRRAEHRPPSSIDEHGLPAACPEKEQRGEAWSEEREHAALCDRAARRDEGEHVHNPARADDERNEAQVGAERPQEWRITPHAWIAPPAVIASVIVDADEHAARAADHGTGPPTAKHSVDNTWD